MSRLQPISIDSKRMLIQIEGGVIGNSYANQTAKGTHRAIAPSRRHSRRRLRRSEEKRLRQSGQVRSRVGSRAVANRAALA